MLNLASLELRRLWLDLYWCYKLVFGLVDVHNDHCNIFELKLDCATRGHPYKLSKRHCTINVRLSFFLKELLMYGITCLVITQLISCPLQDSSVVLYLSSFLITWYNHWNSELILFIRSI